MRQCSGIPSERNVAKIQTKAGIFKEHLAIINLVLELKKKRWKEKTCMPNTEQLVCI